MNWRKTLILVPVIIAVSVAPASLAAATEDAVEDGIQAGVALRKEGKDEAALSLFLSLEPKNPQSVRVLLQISAAAQATGRWVLAYNYLRKAAAFRSDPYYVRNRTVIKTAEDTVNQHVGQFRVIGEPSGAEVRLSGNLIGTLPLSEPVPVELGSYTLEVTKPGFYQLRRSITLTAGGALNQELVELRPSSLTPVAPVASSARATDPPAGSPRADRSWWASRSLSWVLGGATLAAAATAGVALAIREQKVSRWNDENRCLDRSEASRTRQDICGDERETANTAGTVALTAGVAAGVLGTATMVQLLTTRQEPGSSARSAGAACGVGLGRVVCQGTF